MSCSTRFSKHSIEDAESTRDTTNPTQISVQKFKTMDNIKRQSGNDERNEVRVKSEYREGVETAVKTPVKDTGLGSQWRANKDPLGSDYSFDQVRFRCRIDKRSVVGIL